MVTVSPVFNINSGFGLRYDLGVSEYKLPNLNQNLLKPHENGYYEESLGVQQLENIIYKSHNLGFEIFSFSNSPKNLNIKYSSEDELKIFMGIHKRLFNETIRMFKPLVYTLKVEIQKEPTQEKGSNIHEYGGMIFYKGEVSPYYLDFFLRRLGIKVWRGEPSVDIKKLNNNLNHIQHFIYYHFTKERFMMMNPMIFWRDLHVKKLLETKSNIDWLENHKQHKIIDGNKNNDFQRGGGYKYSNKKIELKYPHIWVDWFYECNSDMDWVVKNLEIVS